MYVNDVCQSHLFFLLSNTSKKYWYYKETTHLLSFERATFQQWNVPLGCGHLSLNVCACTVLAAVLSPAHKCLVADWSHCSRIPCAFVSVQPGWDHYLRHYATSFTSLSLLQVIVMQQMASLHRWTFQQNGSQYPSLSHSSSCSSPLSLSLPPFAPCPRIRKWTLARPLQTSAASSLAHFGRQISTKTRDGNTIWLQRVCFDRAMFRMLEIMRTVCGLHVVRNSYICVLLYRVRL